MATREDIDEAALLLFMWRHQLPMGMKRSVVEAIEREDRVFIRFPRKKRTLRIPISYSSSSDAMETEEDPPKADTLEVPYTESSSKPTKNIKRCSLGLPPTGQQPKKARRMPNGRFEAGASSSGTREPTPEWLVQLMRDKNGKDPRHIISRGLTATDIRPHFRRLSMPFNQIVDLEFLTPSEEDIIQRQATKLCKEGVDSILVASNLKKYKLNLRRWNMGNTPPYFLTSGWDRVVSDYGLKVGYKIRLWSFHVGEQLYFAMVPTSPTESGKSIPGRMSSALVIKDTTSDGLSHK